MLAARNGNDRETRPRTSAVRAVAVRATSYDAQVTAIQAALRAGGKLSALLAFFAVAAIAGTLIATPGRLSPLLLLTGPPTTT